MKCIGKSLIGGAIIVLLLGAGTYWTLGKNFTPWAKTVKLSVRDKLEAMVDKYKYELAKSEHAVAQARERVDQVRKASAAAGAGVRRLEGERKIADKEIHNAQAQLNQIEQRLAAGQQVRLASGRVLSTEEIRLRVLDQSQRIDLAQQKLTVLDDVLKRRVERKQKLDEIARQAPLELARLELSVRHLAEKVKLYESQQALFQEEHEAEASLANLFETAQRTLEGAHADLDAKLAEFDAMVGSSLETTASATPATDEAQTQQIIGDIRKILAKDRTPAD